MVTKNYSKTDDGEDSRGGAVFWLVVAVVYALGLVMACGVGAYLAGWRM